MLLNERRDMHTRAEDRRAAVSTAHDVGAVGGVWDGVLRVHLLAYACCCVCNIRSAMFAMLSMWPPSVDARR